MVGSKFVKFLKSIFKRQVNYSSVFASFFIATTHSSALNFELINFLLWTKRPHQSLNFDAFQCSGENLQNYSCHFPNHKSPFLQILYHSLLPLKIPPLYFFRSNIKYVLCIIGTSQSANLWDFWVLWSKFTKFLSFLKQQISFSLNSASLFRVMSHNSSVLVSWNFIYF